MTISIGFIRYMYYRINSHLGIELKKNLLKSLACTTAVNLAGYLAAIIVVSAIVTFIPGLGAINSMSSKDLNGAAKNVIIGMNVDEVMKEAKSEFKREKKDGAESRFFIHSYSC